MFPPEVMLERQQLMIQSANPNGCNLNVGSAHTKFPNFINIDKYVEGPGIVNCDMFDLPYAENTVDIVYSSHSLEHMAYRQAQATLKHWNKLLKTDGMLYLAVPDLEEIMRLMLSPTIDFRSKWTWYIYTMYGFQTDPEYGARNLDLNLPIHDGHFHKFNVTKEWLNVKLPEFGYEIIGEMGNKMMFSYDGWGTPSIWVEAKKL